MSIKEKIAIFEKKHNTVAWNVFFEHLGSFVALAIAVAFCWILRIFGII